MRTQKLALFALCTLIACNERQQAPGDEETDPLLLKVVPSTVQAVGGDGDPWSLVDRATSVGFTPADGAAVRLDFDGTEPVRALKVYGPAPYVVDVRGLGGEAIPGLERVDLSTAPAGWSTFLAS